MEYELYLLCLLGTVIHYLKDFEQHKRLGQKYSLGSLIPTIILSVITTQVLIYLRGDIADLYVITPFSALILGYFGNSVFFSFVDAKKPRQAPVGSDANNNDDVGGGTVGNPK